MFNLKHKITINDLVIIYLAEKLKNGCDNSLDEKEFSDFVKFFNEQKKTNFSFEDYNKFIQKVIDKKIDISCNLYVIGGIARKYSISELDININGDLHCYGEIHCHNINVNGDFYSQDIIYSRNIKVGENFLCIGKLDAYGCNVIVAGDLECNDIIAGKVECLGKIKIKGSISVATGIENYY